jgi:hypothetical protein
MAAKKPSKAAAKRPSAKPAPTKTPRVPNAAQASKAAARAAGPAPKEPAKKQAKNTNQVPRKSTKPRARNDRSAPGPLGPRNGSGSIPYQGGAPQSGGGMGISGFGG